MEVLRAHPRCELKPRVFAAWKAAGLALVLVLAGCNDPVAPSPDGGSASGTPPVAAPEPAPSTGTVATPDPEPVFQPDPVADALPLLSITTDNGQEIYSKEDYQGAHYELTDENGVVLAESTLEIRGRGNTTWGYPKKPYKLKLTSSTSLLGMPANKHWVLLANYLDKTLLRNEAAFHLSEQLGMAWTPRSVEVVVELNGTYRGIYELTEQIRPGAKRVNIPELGATDSDPAVITGGYLIEVDARSGEIFCPVSAHIHVPFCFSSPEDLTMPGREAQRAYIEGYLADTEDALYSGGFADPATGYAAYIDVASTIDFYLLNELLKNADSDFYSSVYLYKPRGGKLFFGPVWDFDRSFGNAIYPAGLDDPTGWYVREGGWFKRLFDDPAFLARVRARWTQLRQDGAIEELVSFIDRRAALLSKVQKRNFELWGVLDEQLEMMAPHLGPYEQQVVDTKSWLRQRVEWLDAQLRDP